MKLLMFFLIMAVCYLNPQDKVVKDTTIRDVSYPIYQSQRGARYIWVISKKTGEPYKKYLTTKAKYITYKVKV